MTPQSGGVILITLDSTETTLPDQRSEDDTTRAAARLPGLDIEIVHRRAANAERISVHVQAMPSFDAFGRFFENANPFAYWAQAAQMMWMPFLSLYAPWLGAARALTPPRTVDEAPPTSPDD
jgi:hypothetical protein